MCRAPFRDLGRSKRDYLTSTSALWGFAPNPLLGESAAPSLPSTGRASVREVRRPLPERKPAEE